MKKKVNVLVTGADGQLGLTIKDLAGAYPNIAFQFYNAKDLDITNRESIDKALGDSSFDYCINCAAYTDVEQAEKKPDLAFKVNADGVKKLAQSCKDNSVILIHLSTDYVFDGEKHEPYTVNDEPNPINEYGMSKLLGEQHIQSILTDYYIVRTSWLYSKDHGNNFYRKILHMARRGQALNITDEQTGRPTSALSLARFLLSLINNNQVNYGILHFCDDKIMTWYDFAEEILREHDLLGHVSLAKAGNYSTFAKRPKYSVLALNSDAIDTKKE